jgi:hypothetical protein
MVDDCQPTFITKKLKKKGKKKKKKNKNIQGNNGHRSSKAHNYVYKRKKLFHRVSSKLLLGKEVFS